jgi:hypothetical protein
VAASGVPISDGPAEALPALEPLAPSPVEATGLGGDCAGAQAERLQPSLRLESAQRRQQRVMVELLIEMGVFSREADLAQVQRR